MVLKKQRNKCISVHTGCVFAYHGVSGYGLKIFFGNFIMGEAELGSNFLLIRLFLSHAIS